MLTRAASAPIVLTKVRHPERRLLCQIGMQTERDRSPGSDEQVLRIDVSFEEAIRRIATKPVPPGRAPAQVRERRWKKKPDSD